MEIERLFKPTMPGATMDAALLTTFCAVRELTFVERGVRGGSQGYWFESRKRDRSFYSDEQLREAVEKISSRRAVPVMTYTS